MAVNPTSGYQANLYNGQATARAAANAASGISAVAATDTVTISGAAKSKSEAVEPTANAAANVNNQQVQQAVQKLKERELQVRTHEQAHESVGGRYAGAPTYTYTKGPDGKSYITGGEVSIDVSKAQTPEETVTKMKQVVASALAPSDPSPADEGVAQKASQLEAQAEQEIAQKDISGSGGQSPAGNSTGAASGNGAKDSTSSGNLPTLQQMQSLYSANTEPPTGKNVSIYA
ncbi:MAG: hypothetical protein HQK97_07360 [Nitrospirae bacterium]|nr:hypothetical protein [Nitrospirota bacterium]